MCHARSFVLTVMVATSCAACAYGERADDVFPISFWGSPALSDPFRTEKAVIRRLYGEDITFRKQSANMNYVSFRRYLDFDGSVGNQVLVAPWVIERQWQWGHDYRKGTYFWKDPDTLEVEADTFRVTVAGWVREAVDNLADHPALLGWALWDEPDRRHYKFVRDTEKNLGPFQDYYLSLFFHDDTLGSPLDSLSVFSLIVHELHRQDTRSGGLVFDNLVSEPASVRGNWWRSVSELKSFDGCLNSIDCIGTMRFPVNLTHPVGSKARFRTAATMFDSAASADTIYTDGRIHFWPFIQGCGWSGMTGGSLVSWHRILTAEEVRLMTNLALQHGAKGLLYWRATRWDLERASSTNYHAGWFDEKLTPFDAPYEEYVYVREHQCYIDPDLLEPFRDGCDPFASSLAPKPERGTEGYYLWKYEPYARRLNALRDINRDVHRIRHSLLGLWKATDQSVAIEPIGVEGDSLTDVPSIVAMTPRLDGEPEVGSAWAYCVNRDFHPAYSPLGCRVKIGISYPADRGEPPGPVIIDYRGRRLRPVRSVAITGSGAEREAWVSFETTLETGAGELVQAIMANAPPPGDFVVTDPDIQIVRPGCENDQQARTAWMGAFPGDGDFVEGDRVRLAADIYNLGFTRADSVSVVFYDGDPRDRTAEIGRTSVSLGPLSDTLPEVARAVVDWELPAGSRGAHDIHVLVNHEHELADDGFVTRFFLPEADSGNDRAHAPLYVFPLDYASAELGNPWDMDEDAEASWRSPDIDSVVGGILEPDSISGVCELRIAGDGSEHGRSSMDIHMRVGSPQESVDPDAYYYFRARIYVDSPCSLQPFWRPSRDEEDAPLRLASPVRLKANEWNVVERDLRKSEWGRGGHVRSFGLAIRGRQGDRVRLSWVKLTRE